MTFLYLLLKSYFVGSFLVYISFLSVQKKGNMAAKTIKFKSISFYYPCKKYSLNLSLIHI